MITAGPPLQTPRRHPCSSGPGLEKPVVPTPESRPIDAELADKEILHARRLTKPDTESKQARMRDGVANTDVAFLLLRSTRR